MNEFHTNIYPESAPFGTCLFHRQIQPKNESFLQMVRFTFVPYLQPYTFTFFYIILNTFMFVYSSSLHGTDSQTQFLKINQAALFELGENYPYYQIKKFHYYRLLTSFVLFRNFYHFAIVSIGICTLTSYIEKYIPRQYRFVGFKRVFLITFCSGIAGQLFGNLMHSHATLQSITPICGMIGYLYGMLFVNRSRQWKNYPTENRNMFLILAFLFGLYIHANVAFSNFSVASAIFALFFGFIFYFSDPNDTNVRCSPLFAIVSMSIVVGILTFLFFFYTNPDRIQAY